MILLNMQRKTVFPILAVLIFALGSCQANHAAYVQYDCFDAQEIIGVWQADYAEYDSDLIGLETITIQTNGAFDQSYTGVIEMVSTKNVAWSIIQLDNGIAQLHLPGGIEFPQIIFSLSESDIEEWTEATFSLIDPAGNERITFSGETILNILFDSRGNITLCHLPAGDPDAPITICFSK